MSLKNSPTCSTVPENPSYGFLKECRHFVETIHAWFWKIFLSTQPQLRAHTEHPTVLDVLFQTSKQKSWSIVSESQELSPSQVILKSIAENGNIPEEYWNFFVQTYMHWQERITRDQIPTTQKPAIAIEDITASIALAVGRCAKAVYTSLNTHPLKHDDGTIKTLPFIQEEHPEIFLFLSYGVQTRSIETRSLSAFLEKIHSTDVDCLLFENNYQNLIQRELQNLVKNPHYQIGQDVKVSLK